MRHFLRNIFLRRPLSAHLFVYLSFDKEAEVYFVAKSDIPGLNAEHESFDELVEIVLDLAPTLLELNADEDDGLAPQNLVVRSKRQFALSCP